MAEDCMCEVLDKRLVHAIAQRMQEAREKHPVFAKDIPDAFLHVTEEYGEVAREISKREHGWKKRMYSELLDLIVVCCRMYSAEYDQETLNADLTTLQSDEHRQLWYALKQDGKRFAVRTR